MNLEDGEFVGDRIKIKTPRPATPEAVAETAAEIVRLAEWDGPVGLTMPSVIKGQIARAAANLDESWIGADVHELVDERLLNPCACIAGGGISR